MLRLLSRNSPLRTLTLISPKTKTLSPPLNPNPNPNLSLHKFYLLTRHFSTNNRNGENDNWNLTPDSSIDSVFDVFDEKPPIENDVKSIFGDFENDAKSNESEGWVLSGEKDEDVFGLGELERENILEVEKDEEREIRVSVLSEKMKLEEIKKLEDEEKALSEVLKGPNRAFGDLISASGITEEMLDSLMALKDLSGVKGLPPLSEIEDMRYEKNTRKSSRADIERQKQEEVAKARVRQVDDKGRAYGTGRRKCSIARVWIQPGEGKFVVNDKEFDVYFPMLDHRAALLRPFSETKTLGLWDISCTVKGGGVSGQVGAVQLGISRALQNWEPNLRPPLRAVGFLTRDPRVVERKKPGKAKARKSFQWVKR